MSTKVTRRNKFYCEQCEFVSEYKANLMRHQEKPRKKKKKLLKYLKQANRQTSFTLMSVNANVDISST